MNSCGLLSKIIEENSDISMDEVMNDEDLMGEIRKNDITTLNL